MCEKYGLGKNADSLTRETDAIIDAMDEVFSRTYS